MATPIGKAAKIAGERGLGGLALAVGRKLCDRHRSIWFDLDLNNSPSVIAPRFDGRLDFDHPEQVLDWIGELNISGICDPVEISSMKERGHLFTGVMDGDRLIGYIKLGWDVVYVLDYRENIRLKPGEFFVIDIFVSPEMRGKGAGPFLVSAASIAMRDRGFTRGIMHVRTDKTPMIKTCARTGYRELGRVDYLSILGKKIFRPHPHTLIHTGYGQ